MDREISPQDRPNLVRDPDGGDAAREVQTPSLSREREVFELRGYRYQISPAELRTLTEIGRFRTIALEDLATYQYQGQIPRMREDLGSLRAQGLLQQRAVWMSGKGGCGEKLTVLVLTKTGKELLEEKAPEGSAQMLFSGFVKPAEVRHDAAIYRMYQLESDRLRRLGAVPERIVLDYELKQKVYRPLAKARVQLSPSDYARKQAEIAAENSLKVVRGRILLPDLRIEYRDKNGERTHVDLELATDHYRGAHMRGKAQAGFKFYAPPDSVGRLTRAFDPELVAEIFSL